LDNYEDIYEEQVFKVKNIDFTKYEYAYIGQITSTSLQKMIQELAKDIWDGVVLEDKYAEEV